MPRCHRCSREFKGDEDYCEPCEEFVRDLHREMGVECLHCGSIFPTAGGFNRHRWQVYYREHEFPRSKRTEL
jgi:DNA-directed RNA polymerase subunit RPC12/RpoP